MFRPFPGWHPRCCAFQLVVSITRRCAYAMDIAKTIVPTQSVMPMGRLVSCHLYDKDGNRVKQTVENKQGTTAPSTLVTERQMR